MAIQGIRLVRLVIEEEEECFYSTIQCNTMIRIKDIYREQFGQETPIKMQLASLSWEPPFSILLETTRAVSATPYFPNSYGDVCMTIIATHGENRSRLSRFR